MCWYCNKLKIKRAKKDIPVWKIVTLPVDNSCDNICKSLYAKFLYFKDTLVTTPIEFEVKRNGFIGNIGFHSYSNKLKLEKRANATFVFRKKPLFKPQQIYITSIGQPDAKIARFHIPRGYQYAENRNGEIISSAIVFDDFID